MASMTAAYNRTQAVQRSFDLLCEYLNFGEETGFVKHILSSRFVKPFFDEYRRDYLENTGEIDEIEFYSLQSFCGQNDAFKLSSKYSSPSVDKIMWSPLDHAARFIVQTLQYSWCESNGPWDCGEWDLESDDSDVEFWQVWMILRYMQGEWESINLTDWSEDSLVDMFEQHSLQMKR